ncbi:MAG: general secretion pathway protein GspK [Candidatus Omnitrophica bacterium]|nr:general secretion pathway protein GspK [Candidatus Omnitrophota bacterium]
MVSGGRRRRGSVFILTVWMVGVLGFFAVSVGVSVRASIDAVRRLELRERLYRAAEAGIHAMVQEVVQAAREERPPAFGLAAAGGRQWDMLQVSCGAWRRSADYLPGGGSENFWWPGAQDETAKLNINTAPPETLQRLLVLVGGRDMNSAQRLAAAIVDWRDADEQPLTQGAESSYYRRLPVPYACADAPFSAVEELRLVRDADAAVLNRIQPYITIYGSGAVNLNEAAAPVLAALALGDSLIRKIIRFRCGPDGLFLTEDDRRFSAAAAIVPELSRIEALTPDEASILSRAVADKIVGVASAWFYFDSTAVQPESGAACRITSVFERRRGAEGNPRMQMKQWRTFFLHEGNSAARGGAGSLRGEL